MALTRRSWDNFEITERPPWDRNEESSSTKLMIQEIKAIKESCGATSTRSATSQEQDWWAYASRETTDKRDQQKLEERSRNICNAIKILQDYRSDMNEQKDNVNTLTVRMLTPDILCDVNRELVYSRYPKDSQAGPDSESQAPPGYPKDAGKFRESMVWTLRPDNQYHHYPNYLFIDTHINDILDNHNMHFDHYLYNMKHSNSVSEEEKITYLVKCAAWLFCRVITLHPFCNGNGRLCRILANDVLMEMAPFPVLMYNFGAVTKDTYFDAIIQYQGDAAPEPPEKPNTSNDPELISALLVEGLWHGWKDYKKKIEIV